MDVVSPSVRSRMMRNIRSRNTRPEILVRRCLHASGFRYRLGTRILGTKPDVVLARHRVAVFVHGCFWHRHENCRHAATPGSNVEFWQAKFRTNMARDSAVVEKLLAAGWRVVVVWECWSKRKLALDWLATWIRDSDEAFVSWPLVDDRDVRRS